MPNNSASHSVAPCLLEGVVNRNPIACAPKDAAYRSTKQFSDKHLAKVWLFIHVFEINDANSANILPYAHTAHSMSGNHVENKNHHKHRGRRSFIGRDWMLQVP